MTLDATDRQILNHLQEGFPIDPNPFAIVAQELELTAEDVCARLVRMKEDGVITRFGPFFDAEAMGGAFCLCAMAVPADKFETAMIQVNARPEVAHNYERNHHLNMWFVLATETTEEIQQVAQSIEQETGCSVLRFPKRKEFFIGFRVTA